MNEFEVWYYILCTDYSLDNIGLIISLVNTPWRRRRCWSKILHITIIQFNSILCMVPYTSRRSSSTASTHHSLHGPDTYIISKSDHSLSDPYICTYIFESVILYVYVWDLRFTSYIKMIRSDSQETEQTSLRIIELCTCERVNQYLKTVFDRLY